MNMTWWAEYDSAAEWCAKRGIKGNEGDPLPENLSADCYAAINDDPDAWRQRINDSAYAIGMESLNLSADPIPIGTGYLNVDEETQP